MLKKNICNSQNGRYLLFFDTIFVSLTLLATFTVLEAALRLAWPQVFLPHPPGMYSADDDIGYVLTPGFEGSFRGAEFNTSVRINSTGLRGEELRLRKENSIRILCLGDSFTWGWGVNDNEAYPAELEKLLQDHYDFLDVQVLNAGVSGYGTVDELEFLKKLGARLNPDIVLLQFFSGNDFSDNRFPANRYVEVRNEMLYQTAAHPMPFWMRNLERLKKRSHLVHLVSNRSGAVVMRLGLMDDLTNPLSNHFNEEDRQQAMDFLGEIGSVTQGLGAKALFIFVPEKLQVLSAPKMPLRAATLVREAADTAGALSIDLTPELVYAENPNALYFTQDAHWTAKGHKMAAHILFQEIRDSGLIQSEYSVLE